ncbi:hypothetical protein LSAT2_024204 [Lamellibrachia satsuma]|nr:hypothetical protein LSAT2_024204 [Lamellibrachia satsuma]
MYVALLTLASVLATTSSTAIEAHLEPDRNGGDQEICVNDCAGSYGTFGSCISCHRYVLCTRFGTLIQQRCPNNYEWDSHLGTCAPHSGTCRRGCIRNCQGLTAGNYQSCVSCHAFATCDSTGRLYDNRLCPGNLVWDDKKKRCEFTSATCRGANL